MNKVSDRLSGALPLGAAWLGLWIFFLAGQSVAFGQAGMSVGSQRSLDGTWKIIPDRENVGLERAWPAGEDFPSKEVRSVPVPGNTYQALPGYNGIAWYRREFSLASIPRPGWRTFLRFGAVQYLCRVWLNGVEIGRHEGAEAPFEFEATGQMRSGSNTLVLRVENPLGIFRNGKLPVFFDEGGMVGHVDLIEQPLVRIAEVYAKPNPFTGALALDVTCDNGGAPTSLELTAAIADRDSHLERARAQLRVQVPAGSSTQRLLLQIASPHQWNLDDPFLYSVSVTASADGRQDINRIERIGFRDFRVRDGFFELNGRRIFLQGCHSNHLDPVIIQGVPGSMNWRGDMAKLKAAGFNLYRSLSAAFLPEQLAAADELGLLMFSDHAGSWLLRDKTKFAIGLADVLRRDRNSPSLVMFGLLNEIDARSPGVYEVVRGTLPLIRETDENILVMLSSGRWDRDFVTGSASNPGSDRWDVFMGGEGPASRATGDLPDMAANDDKTIPAGGFINGAGDAHVYNSHPNSLAFIDALRTFAASTRPVFISESGCGSMFDPYTEQRDLIAAKAPANASAWTWTKQHISELEGVWKRYKLDEAYPNLPAMIAASQRNAAEERELLTRAIRSNPQICGYSVTSFTDAFGLGEGIFDNFRGWKAGHREGIAAGWAPTRFCLFANPSPVRRGEPIRVVVALADEDRLSSGPRRVTLRLRDSGGAERWSKICSINLGEKWKRPLAQVVFDQVIAPPPLMEGTAVLEAHLEGAGDLTGSRLSIPVYDSERTARLAGSVLAVGLGQKAPALLRQAGAKVEEYHPAVGIDGTVILCGEALPASWGAEAWREVYAQVAQGAHLLVIGPNVLRGSSGPNHFLPLAQRGKLEGKPDAAIYHREVVAKPGLVFAQLPSGLLTGSVYGHLLNGTKELTGATPPDSVIAMAFNGSGMGAIGDGLVIATWHYGAGQITVCTLDLLKELGTPVPDRLLINLVHYAQSHASALTR